MKADREENDGVVEQNYKNLCLSTRVTSKKTPKLYGHDIIAICMILLNSLS